MQGVWLPVHVSVLLRRVVNVLSSLSLAHHAVLPRDDSDPNPIRYLSTGISIPWPRLRWPTTFFSAEPETRTSSSSPPPPSPPSSPKPTNSSPKPHQSRPPPPSPPEDTRTDPIHVLMRSPTLYDPVRTPRFPIVLCHGLYGFDVRGPSALPSLRMHYWADVRNVLRKTVGADVVITSVPGTGSIAERATELDRFLRTSVAGRGVNLLAHSMGGLDGRHLITHIRPTEYTPLSLTSVATPHRGSPFMDWCTDYLGLGRTDVEREKRRLAAKAAQQYCADDEDVAAVDLEYAHVEAELDLPKSTPDPSTSTGAGAFASLANLPSSFTALLLSMFDSPAYANLTTAYLTNVFNPSTPDDPRVRYFSVGGRARGMSVWHPLWFPKLVVDGAEERERQSCAATSAASSPASPDGASLSPNVLSLPNAQEDDVWGNDGLVTLRSARWGEWLGTLEGADHWRMRGASGTELGAQLPALVSREWGRVSRVLGRSIDDPPTDQAEALRSSTARLSAVVDWLIEQVPTQKERESVKESVKERERRKADLEADDDLERFYVALARKLWDEGL